MDMESFAFDLLQVGLRTWKQMIHHLFFWTSKLDSANGKSLQNIERIGGEQCSIVSVSKKFY